MPTPVKKPIGPIRRPTSWSFSAWHLYKECARRYRYTKLDKLPTAPMGPAVERGQAVHLEGERYLKGTLNKLPQAYQAFTHEMKTLRKLKALSEASWTFTDRWAETRWDDWKGAWLRVKLDSGFITTAQDYAKKFAPALRDPACQEYLWKLEEVLASTKQVKLVAEVIDFKTGKVYDGYQDQCELYALATFQKFPDVDLVGPSLWFLDVGSMIGGPHATRAVRDVPTWYSRAQVPTMEKRWRREATTMLKDTKFLARPGGYCTWCDFSKAKGGPCEH